MLVDRSDPSRHLSEDDVRRVMTEALAEADLAGRRVLILIPDGTRTAPMALLFRLFGELLGESVAALDYLVAPGTHLPLDDRDLGSLLGAEVRDGRAGASRIHNHHWDSEETFVTLGTLAAAEVEELSAGRLSVDVPVRLNRLVAGPDGGSSYDRLVVCGPVFPHEVAGFSGGNKYFVPGVASPEIIDATHWLGALLTSRRTIGVADTPVRRMIDRAASLVSTPRLGVALVMKGEALHGLFIGSMDESWRAAVELSARLNVVTVERPFRRVLSVMPRMYHDLWTAAKGMYKLEPAIADGGEVVIYAPHISEVSYTHGPLIDEIGYHVRDYFLAHWERFEHYPWCVLAHSTHLRGDGIYRDGREQPRVRVTLASGIARERCERLCLGYQDPQTIAPEEWAGREEEGVLLVRRAGEILYRVRGEA